LFCWVLANLLSKGALRFRRGAGRTARRVAAANEGRAVRAKAEMPLSTFEKSFRQPQLNPIDLIENIIRSCEKFLDMQSGALTS